MARETSLQVATCPGAQAEGGYTISCPLVPALLELYQALDKPVPAALRTLVTDSDSPIWAETLVLADTA